MVPAAEVLNLRPGAELPREGADRLKEILH
jgi:hypothetical protein